MDYSATTPEIAELTMMHIIRDTAVASQFRMMNVVGADFRGTQYEYLAPIWDAIRMYMDKGFSDPPPFDVLIGLLSQAIAAYGGMPPHVVSHIGDLVRRAFAVPKDDLRPLYVLSSTGPLHTMGVELKLAPALRVAAMETNPGRVMEALKKADEIREQVRVAGAQHADIMSPERILELTSVSEIEQTGVDFWDAAVYGLPKVCAGGFLAVTGGGKTTFAAQLTMESVMRDRNTMFFAYEQQLDGDLVERVYRLLLNIPREKLQSGDYTPEIVQRLQQVRYLVEARLRIFQMAGDKEGQGAGGPPEIEAIITNYITQYGWKPDLIVLDWLEPILRRWVGVASTGVKDYQKQLKYVLDAVKQIRDKFKIKVIILHQLAAAQAEKMTPAQMPDHYMAAEIKSFADLLNVSCALGKVDPSTMCMHANWTKCRWSRTTNRIVKLNAEYDRIEDCKHMEMNPDWRATDEPLFRNRKDDQQPA